MKQLFVAAAICVATAAHATVLVPLDTQAMTARADRVLLGTVESLAAHWTDDRQAIYTDVTVRVSRAYKGSAKPGERVVVRREGGVVGGVGMKVFGAAHFVAGEEVLLFLENRGGSAYTVGMTQGKLAVVTGADGIKRVAANVADVAFTRPDARILASQPRRLDDLERDLARFVRGAQ
ncbi:MAG: hypothetical protein JWN44_1223 [Myxococcales bacterium]|nr:hypothetical protein [Myxococcales bacterium]